MKFGAAMTLSVGSRFVLSIVLAMSLIAVLGVANPAPAHADRCQPEELITGAGSSPVDERDHPACYVLINYVYPFVCRDYSTLGNCMGSIELDTGYRPGIAPYTPDPGRIVCNLARYVGFGCTTVPVPDVP
jgi:hypothetical protein